MKIFLTAGEASGDLLGAQLIKSLRQISPHPIDFFGVGGEAMRTEGLTSQFPVTDLSVMGLAEILPRLPILIKRINQTAQTIAEIKPDIVVTIDSPDFSFRVARKVRKIMPKVPRMVHYVAPTVWAWRPERAAKLARLYDGVICLFPFEPHYFEREGMKAVFAGHPAAGYDFSPAAAKKFRTNRAIEPDMEILGVLFGSRAGELRRTGNIIRQAVQKFIFDKKNIALVAPTLPHLKKSAIELTQGMGCPVFVTDDPAEKWGSFASMKAAVAVSGTVGLELAMANVPHIIGYRVNPLTYEIARRKIKIKYAHLANILLDAPAVPEFIQKNCTSEALAAVLDSVWNDPGEQMNAFKSVRDMIISHNEKSPSRVAAGFILEIAR